MGVDAGDFDADGDEDVFVGELTGQGADLYVNDGSGVFVEESARAGLRLRTLPFTAFGAAWLDADNDGQLDLAIANGAVTHTAEALAANERFRLQQRRQLFRNVGKGRFEEITGRAGPAFTAEAVGRGAAFGDLDNDGDTDIVVANDNGPVRLLVNNVGSRSRWMGLRLLTAKRDALGARVTISRTRRCSRGAPGRMAATHPRMIRACSSASAKRRRRGFASSCTGQAAAPKSGRTSRSIGIRRSKRARHPGSDLRHEIAGSDARNSLNLLRNSRFSGLSGPAIRLDLPVLHRFNSRAPCRGRSVV
jgi:hypothetical protein